MSLPSFESYGDYTSDNYGAHTLRFRFGPVSVWYSYKTVVAFKVSNNPLVVLNYTDSRTTYKHLKKIDGGAKSSRISQKEFDAAWEKQVAPYMRESVA